MNSLSLQQRAYEAQHAQTNQAELIERIARAIGVGSAVTVGPDDLDVRLPEVFREGLSRRGLALIVVRTPCDRSE